MSSDTTTIPIDLEMLLGDRTPELVNFFLACIKPPSTEPIWQWAQRHIELSAATSDIPGAIRYDLFPASIAFFNWAQNPRCRRITLIACAQSCKTEDAITYALWRIKENPTPTMWAMAVADQCEDFAKDRLFPAVQNCATVFEIAPHDRKLWTKRMIKFDTMTLHLRGSNSKAKLQSSPIGLIICDERREWRKGSIGTIRKRLTTFADSQEISTGVAGHKLDELHCDFDEGSQTFMHFRCLQCQHSQPWRFGKTPTVLFPDPRPRGGVTWPKNDLTKPDGQWDYNQVEQLARYECENCGHQYENTDKPALLATTHEHHRNPKALPKHVSMQRHGLMMPWAENSFGKMAVRFLKAMAALKHGDMEPLYTLITEDFGEPFEPPGARKQKGDLQNRITKYKLGQYWLDPDDPTGQRLEPKTALVLTFDRQLMYLRYVVRQWRSNGQSRLVHHGKSASLDDLRALQFQLKIRDACVWGDDGGPNASEFRQACLRWHWHILKGEDYKHFTIQAKKDGKDISHRQGWRVTQFDPGIGTTREGLATIEATLWSNPWYKDKLYFLFITGHGPLWEIPEDIDAEYMTEVTANEWDEKDNEFKESGPDHAADCELMQLVVADRGGFTRTLHTPPPSASAPPPGDKPTEN